MIDSDGFRPNVGIILCNDDGNVFWARRIGHRGWQFPQGGIRRSETPLQAMYRELWEETGLLPGHVEVMARTRRWLRYRLPARLIRHGRRPVCIGQKQIWFLIRLEADETMVRFDCTGQPEFDGWQWVHYWRPVRDVIAFKRHVYRRALTELAPFLFDPNADANKDSRVIQRVE